MPNPILHFEIPADDVERAKAFYQRTFGWTITPFPMPPGEECLGVTTRQKGEPGIDGGMMKRKMPGQPFTNYITVASIDEMHQRIHANGGVVVMPKQEIGQGMGWISAFKDTENNIMGLHQMAPAPPARASARKASSRRSAKKAATKKKTAARKKRRR
jgi:uncharacterized protein